MDKLWVDYSNTYILVITIGEFMNCIDHCFTLAHVYFVYLIKTNLTLLRGIKWWSGGTSSPLTIREVRYYLVTQAYLVQLN